MALFSKDLELALSGELQAYLDEADYNVMDAARFALHNIVEKGKRSLRGMVAAAGLAKEGAGEGRGTGRSLASAIRFSLYPANGVARNPAALLYIQPSAVRIFEAFEEGATIRAKEGRFITIPIPGSPADRVNFGDNPNGETVLQRLKARGVEVKFVPGTATRPAMLVGESVRIRTNPKGKLKVSRAARTKTGSLASGATSVPLFFLVEKARIDKRLNLAREFQRLADDFVTTFAAELTAVLARMESGQGERSYERRRGAFAQRESGRRR